MISIPLVLAFTPSYIIPAVTTILSVLLHSKPTDKFQIICLLTEDLTCEIQTLLSSWESERLEFVFINLSGQLGDIYIDERYSVAASYRLLLPEILPHYKRVMYLDCDIIVRNNIAELYHNTSLDTYYLAGVFESTLDFQIPYLESINCNPGEYINSGFLIMNLEKMRVDHIVPELLQKADNPKFSFPDQDALNIVCKGKILGLSPIYNSIRTYFLPQYKVDFLKYYTVQDWDNVQKNGTIHYTGSKPWNGYTIEFSTWWQYYAQLPEAIKLLGSVNSRLKFAGTLMGYTPIRIVFNIFQGIYRKLKLKN